MKAVSLVRARWICSQLGAREHYAIPRALAQRGDLRCLLTDAWVRRGGLLGLLNRNLRDRFHPDLAGAAVWRWTTGLLVFEIMARARRLAGWPLIQARNRWFQARAGRYLAEKMGTGGILFSYSYAALALFQVAKQRGWRTVLGQIDPGPPEERIIAQLHARWPEYSGAWQAAPAEYWAAWREECRLADVIMVNSQWSREAMLEEGVAADKIAVVPLAYDPPTQCGNSPRRYPQAFSRQRPLRVLFLGQANLRKGIHDLVAAAEAMQCEPVVFDVAGGHGPLPRSLPDNIRFHGPVARDEVSRWYGQADLFVLPTHSDGFALTQIEAMAHGLPVIATPRCGAVVRPNENGWIIEPGNPSQLSAVLGEARSRPRRLADMSAVAVNRARDFSLDRLGDRLFQIANGGEPRTNPGPRAGNFL
jgi:glycosyltransferase involved in cell wall biosynthesis